jgi:hypothetical protein
MSAKFDKPAGYRLHRNRDNALPGGWCRRHDMLSKAVESMICVPERQRGPS